MAAAREVRCLIVEDDEDYVALIRSFLAEIADVSFDVRWEATFDSALAALWDSRFDVCLVDHFLDGADGLTFIKKAKVAGNDTPMIVLSGAGDDVADAASAVGAANFLSKDDLSRAVLANTIRFAMANQAQTAALRDQQAETAAALRELSAQKALLQLAVDHTIHGIALFDPDQRLITCNSKYHQIYGFDPRVVRPGMLLTEILQYSVSLGNFAGPEAERAMAERRAQTALSHASRNEQKMSDGRTISVHHEIIDGGLSVTTCEDITETLASRQRHADLAREAALADAEARAKTKFLSNMSHELRTPLNAIMGFCDAMRQEMFGPLGAARYKDYAESSHDAAADLLHIVEQVLDISRLSADDMPLDEAEFSLADVVAREVERHRAAAEQKSQALTGAHKAGPIRLRGDAGKIGHALNNIIENAVKFSLPGGAIEVTTTLDDENGVVITVADTGTGIPASTLKSAMAPFGQAEEAEARQHHGAGLGLPIALGFVRLHGGDILLDSTADSGTTVTILLPAARVVAPAKATPGSAGT